MQVVFLGRGSRRSNRPPEIGGDVIELLSSDWDDYGNQTTFVTSSRLNDELVELGTIRILFSGISQSRVHLNKLRTNGWNGHFPPPDLGYVSVPSEISFYEQIKSRLGSEAAISLAITLRDASYLVRVIDDEAAKALILTEAFENSLQRERGSIKSFLDGWKTLTSESIAVLDLGFRFVDVLDKESVINLKFQSKSILPHDINVLIGPNGSGKSRILHQIVDDWISPAKTPERGFTAKPNLSQVVVVSYSPFEKFPVDLRREQLQDQNAYRYFGFRGRSPTRLEDKPGRIRLSHEYPKRNAAHSLVSALSFDQRYRAIKDWAQRLRTIERVLQPAFAFDFAALEVSDAARPESFYEADGFGDVPELNEMRILIDGAQYIPVRSENLNYLDASVLEKELKPESGVTFFKRGQPIELSSGQRLFSYIVINIVGAIRANSLILIDEPELFLHPTLEIQFVDMLKKILVQFNSKALLATHSVVTVREMPADCVHVLERLEDEVSLKNPPFQTFGGDVQRISSYVFSDRAASKPFEAWIAERVDELGSSDAVLEQLGSDVNEELIVQIKAMQRDQW